MKTSLLASAARSRADRTRPLVHRHYSHPRVDFCTRGCFFRIRITPTIEF
jgi:hypothetical protein